MTSYCNYYQIVSDHVNILIAGGRFLILTMPLPMCRSPLMPTRVRRVKCAS